MEWYLYIKLSVDKIGKTGKPVEKFIESIIPKYSTRKMEIDDPSPEVFQLKREIKVLKEEGTKVIYEVVFNHPEFLSAIDYKKDSSTQKFIGYVNSYISYFGVLYKPQILKQETGGDKKSLWEISSQNISKNKDVVIEDDIKPALDDAGETAKKYLKYAGIGLALFAGFKIAINYNGEK